MILKRRYKVWKTSLLNMTKKDWQQLNEDTFNNLFAREYNLKFKLPSVFIDTYYDKDNAFELKKFKEETQRLINFARNR